MEQAYIFEILGVDAMGERFRIGLVGCGYWGSKYLRLLREHPAIDLAFVVDAEADRLRAAEDSFKGVPTFSSLEDAVSKSGAPRAVVVATPASSHRSVVATCLDMGLDVLVEKPMALTTEDALAMVHRSKERGRLLFPGHVFAFNDAVRYLSSQVKNNRLGKILYAVCSRTSLGPIRRDVNALWDLIPHDLTILEALGLTQPHEVWSNGDSFLQADIEDVVVSGLRYPGGQAAYIHTSWLSPAKVRQVSVVGTDAMAVFDDTAIDNPVQIFDKGITQAQTQTYGEFKSQVRTGDTYLPKITSREPLRNMVDAFLECLAANEYPIEEVRRSVMTVHVVEALSQALRQGGHRSIKDWSFVDAL